MQIQHMVVQTQASQLSATHTIKEDNLIHVLDLMDTDLDESTKIKCNVNILDSVSFFSGYGPVNFIQLLCYQYCKTMLIHFFSDKYFALAFLTVYPSLKSLWEEQLSREKETFRAKNSGIFQEFRECLIESLGVDPECEEMSYKQYDGKSDARKITERLNVQKKYKRMEKIKEKQGKLLPLVKNDGKGQNKRQKK
ncbi:hypothetical protein FGO68_gene2330 [Halteria grandinella]|uniref:Uncharacterized protein n=1 Tax=Halteria grandinella TaxID=5974 RepID=A0A8J8NYC2_HALGN|nr:hypothetical protein FGO68_gene2330 [Halteria grandinella]